MENPKTKKKTIHCYYYDENATPRTTETFTENGKKAEELNKKRKTKKEIFCSGLKGTTVLEQVPFLDLTKQVPHCSLMDVAKMMKLGFVSDKTSPRVLSILCRNCELCYFFFFFFVIYFLIFSFFLYLILYLTLFIGTLRNRHGSPN